jgi:hypothetical protein
MYVHFCVKRPRVAYKNKNIFGNVIYLFIFAAKFNQLNILHYEINYSI